MRAYRKFWKTKYLEMEPDSNEVTRHTMFRPQNILFKIFFDSFEYLGVIINNKAYKPMEKLE